MSTTNQPNASDRLDSALRRLRALAVAAAGPGAAPFRTLTDGLQADYLEAMADLACDAFDARQAERQT